MSIPLRNDLSLNVNVTHGKCFVVGKEQKQESLAEYVQRVRNEKNLSLMDVSRRSGGLIANAHISRIENGWVKSVGVEKLKALAKGLGVPEEEVFAAARGARLSEGEEVDADMALFASRVKKLTPQQRRDFEIAWRMANDLLDRLEKEKEQAGQK